MIDIKCLNKKNSCCPGKENSTKNGHPFYKQIKKFGVEGFSECFQHIFYSICLYFIWAGGDEKLFGMAYGSLVFNDAVPFNDHFTRLFDNSYTSMTKRVFLRKV